MGLLSFGRVAAPPGNVGPCGILRHPAAPGGSMRRLGHARALGLVRASCATQPSTVAGPVAPTAEARAAAHFDSIRRDPLRLALFLRAMPKGGDLHNHLSGAVYA